MRIKQLSFLSVLAIAVGLYSCDKEDNNTIASDNKPKVEMDEYTQAGIQNFIDQVNGVTTRTEPTDPPTEEYNLRKYVKVNGESDCIKGKGTCLPEVVVYPPTYRPDYPGTYYPGGWTNTIQGAKLQKMVDNKQITLRKDMNEATHTEYYIYNDVKDQNQEIVVPVINE